MINNVNQSQSWCKHDMEVFLKKNWKHHMNHMWSRWHINVFQQNMTNMTLEEDQNMFRNASVAWPLGVSLCDQRKMAVPENHQSPSIIAPTVKVGEAYPFQRPLTPPRIRATVLQLLLQLSQLWNFETTTKQNWRGSLYNRKIVVAKSQDWLFILFSVGWNPDSSASTLKMNTFCCFHVNLQSFLPLLSYYFAMIASWTHYCFAIIALTSHHFLTNTINLVNIAGSSTISTAQRLTVLMTCWLFFGWMAMSIRQT